MKLHGTTFITYKEEKLVCIVDACFAELLCSLSRYMPNIMHKMTVSRMTNAMMATRINPVVLRYSPRVKRILKNGIIFYQNMHYPACCCL